MSRRDWRLFIPKSVTVCVSLISGAGIALMLMLAPASAPRANVHEQSIEADD
jgi:hypothetical protein